MAVAIAFSPAEWQADIGGTITITGLATTTSFDVQIYTTGDAPATTTTVGGISGVGFGGGQTRRLVSDGGGQIVTTWVPSNTQPVNVAVYALPVQQGSTSTVQVVSGE